MEAEGGKVGGGGSFLAEYQGEIQDNDHEEHSQLLSDHRVNQKFYQSQDLRKEEEDDFRSLR